MKNIVFATDFSNEAYNALFYNTKLFEKKECHFYLLNTYYLHKSRIANYTLAGEGLQESLNPGDLSKEALLSTLHRINLDVPNPKHSYDIVSEKGNLQETLNDLAGQLKIDLLVLGNGKKKGLTALLFGNQLKESIEKVRNCPILIVPEAYEYSAPRHVAFATDYKNYFHARVLFPLLTLAGEWNSKVFTVHVKEKEDLSIRQKANMATLKKYMAHLNHSTYLMPKFSNKSKVIDTFIKELGIDMLVMMHYEHGLFNRLIKKPILEELCMSVEIPLLIIPCNN